MMCFSSIYVCDCNIIELNNNRISSLSRPGFFCTFWIYSCKMKNIRTFLVSIQNLSEGKKCSCEIFSPVPCFVLFPYFNRPHMLWLSPFTAEDKIYFWNTHKKMKQAWSLLLCWQQKIGNFTSNRLTIF